MEGTMAVITCFAGTFAPRNWAYCSGQLLAISTNQALFSLLGTTYGGNGVNTFGLPDLRGRTPVSAGQGLGLPPYSLGQLSGTETVTLNASNLPPHNHNGNAIYKLMVDSQDGSVAEPDYNYPAGLAGAYNNTQDGTMLAPTYLNTSVINPNGGSAPMPIRSPYLGMSFVICLYGIFPSRN
jgi:microcystin-dependent protein